MCVRLPRSWRLAAGIAALSIASSNLPARAATYHVDRSSPACSDFGPGTPLQPYCTITAALDARGDDGNTIVVAAGTYPEQVRVPASGRSGRPLVIQSGPGGAVVDGSDSFAVDSLWMPYSGSVWVAASVTWSPNQVFLDGQRLEPTSESRSELPARTFRWVSGSGLYVNAGGGHPAAHQVRVGRRDHGFTLSDRSWVVIEGFTVTRTEDRGIDLSSSCENVTLVRNTVSFAHRMGIHVSGGDRIVIGSNTVHDCGGHGIQLADGADGCTIEDNESRANGVDDSESANGIYLSGASDNVLRRNRVHGNEDAGIQLTDSDDCVSYLNASWNNGESGFGHLGSSGTIHVRDVAYGNLEDGFSFADGSTGARLHNSISIENGLTTNAYDLRVSDSAEGFASDDNIFWNSGPQAPVRFDGVAYASVAAYGAASGRDGRTLQADPRFMNPAAGDFHLRPGSPAVDNGNSAAPGWPGSDAEGKAPFDDSMIANTGIGVPNYADRGAYEYINLPPDGRIDAPLVDARIIAGQGLVFASSASDADGDMPLSCLWDFGGGAANLSVHDPGTIVMTTPGTFTVTLTVTDARGMPDPAPDRRVITVLEGGCIEGTNMIANTSFETGLEGWRGVDGTIARVPGGKAGSFACRVSGSDDDDDFCLDDAPNGVAVAQEDQRYLFSAWVRSDDSRGRARITVREYEDGDRVGGDDSPEVTLSPQWQRLEVEYVVEEDGTTLEMRVRNRPEDDEEWFDVDDVSICLLTPASPAAALEEDEPDVPFLAVPTIAPNPVVGQARLTFSTRRAGPLRVAVFDLAGRRVRTLADLGDAPAGTHALPVNDGGMGAPLGAGLYFFRIESADGRSSGRFLVVR